MPDDLTVDSATAAGMSDVESVPGVAKPDPILVVDNLSRKFGGLTAVDVHHLEVQRGIVTSLIGPNGAGKSTFFNLITGFDKADTGDWSFEGQRITGKGGHVIAKRGLVRTFQLTRSLMRLTVLENVMLGATGQLGEHFVPAMLRPLWRGQEKAIRVRAEEVLDRFNLGAKRDDYAGSLSGGQRKLLEMARALMVKPTLVMLDEPMAGVNPRLRQTLLDHLRALRDEGMTIVLVEHDMDVVMDVSDWVACFAEGQLIAEGTPDSIRRNEAVIEAYLGVKRSLPESTAATPAYETEHSDAAPTDEEQSDG